MINMARIYLATKSILHKSSGLIEGGKLTAIMGSSGAGKTTMMNVLAQDCLKILISDSLNNQKNKRYFSKQLKAESWRT